MRHVNKREYEVSSNRESIPNSDPGLSSEFGTDVCLFLEWHLVPWLSYW